MPAETRQTIVLGEAANLKPGACARFELPHGDELAVFNVDGEYYATEDFCPHKGALLTEGNLSGHIIECGWHGWQFDVRTGSCITVNETLKTYQIRVQDGMLLLEI